MRIRHELMIAQARAAYLQSLLDNATQALNIIWNILHDESSIPHQDIQLKRIYNVVEVWHTEADRNNNEQT